MGIHVTGIELVLLGVVVWAVLMVTGLVAWTLYRTDRNYQRSLDCLMVLTNKEAAVVSSQIERVREAPSNGKAKRAKLITNEKEKLQTQRDAVLEKIDQTGVVTEEQATFLSENPSLGSQ